MTQMFSALRWRAVADLQNMRAKSHPGSLEFDACDRAIDYILDGQRRDSPYLARNAYRNARWSIVRERRAEIATVPVLASTLDWIEASALDHSRRHDDAELPVGAEHYLSRRENMEALRSRLGAINSRAPQVLDHWRNGMDVAATAKVLCISTHYVKKLRRTIQTVACTYEAAA